MDKKALADYKEEVGINRMIADFMTASTPIEIYLQRDLPLTAMQWDLINQTVSGLKLFTDKWKQNHG